MNDRTFKGRYTFDRFIKVTEAADILGYAHFNSINKMIERGDLTAYRLPHVSRRRVLESEVLAIKNTTSGNSEPKGKGKRGRPRKYPSLNHLIES